MEVEAKIDRYVANPGQALSYMMGRLEIQRMRADAQRARGPVRYSPVPRRGLDQRDPADAGVGIGGARLGRYPAVSVPL